MGLMQLPVNPPVLPMLAKRVSELPKSGEWIFEPKWDGFRALIFREGKEILAEGEKPGAEAVTFHEPALRPIME